MFAEAGISMHLACSARTPGRNSMDGQRAVRASAH
jgi:hypothetical protein